MNFTLPLADWCLGTWHTEGIGSGAKRHAADAARMTK
jgi:hypothetical protein